MDPRNTSEPDGQIPMERWLCPRNDYEHHLGRSRIPPSGGSIARQSSIYVNLRMASATIRIRLEQRAVDVALQPRRAAAPALHPLARMILAEAAPDAAETATRIVICTVPEARALLDHFDGLCATLTGLGDADAGVCATARDSIRRALVGTGR